MEAYDGERLKQEAPLLHGIPRTDPFEVPQGFFDRFPHQVQQQVTARPAGRWPLQLRRAVIALPLVAVLAVLIRYFALDHAPSENMVAAVDTTTAPTVDDLLLLDDDGTFAALAEEDPQAALGSAPDLTDEEIVAYFEDEGTDITELLTTL
ncbi:MAG: hypothetical protein H6597_07840 [Flavobacteriales bacterium]|nr:hypothetical protein [Flavobacteriales bacterium]MCB9194428.1 hypothetical protein [Flavobacteriales bacterium]